MTTTDQPAAASAARAALVAQVGPDVVGDEQRTEAEAGGGVVTCYFACTQAGYPGWEWAVTVAVATPAEAPDQTAPDPERFTVDEVVLLPGAQAIVAPAWVPYRDRVRAGDLSPGDLLPTDEDDARLVPAYLAADPDGTPDDDHGPGRADQAHDRDDEHDRAQLRAVAEQLGLGRTRVLSVEGRERAADRWLASDQGPEAELARQAPHPCWSCGFLVRLSGPLSETFGVCANEFANDDGRVVSFGHGCGAHSDAQLRRKQLPVPVPDPVFDTLTPEDLERF